MHIYEKYIKIYPMPTKKNRFHLILTFRPELVEDGRSMSKS